MTEEKPKVWDSFKGLKPNDLVTVYDTTNGSYEITVEQLMKEQEDEMGY